MTRRHRYSADYEVQEKEVQTKSKTKTKKTIIYKGTYYSLDASKDKIKKIKLAHLLYAIIIAVVFLLLGMINNDGTRKFYILMPYIFMFLPIYYGLLGAIKFMTTKEQMTRVEYEHSIQRIKRSGFSLLILSITAVLGEIIYIVNCKITDVRSLEYLFLAGCFFVGILTQLMLQLQKKVNLLEK